MKILFQGDSITDAFRKPDELNPAFQLGNGYAFLAAAELAGQYPGRGFEFINRGVSGNTICELSARWEEDTLAIGPDVLSLLIGVNDTIRAMQGGRFAGDGQFIEICGILLDSAKRQNPDLRIFVLEPFLLEVGDVTAEWRAHLAPRQAGVARLAAERDLAFLPLQRLFDQACEAAPASYWSYDGIHPTHAGFALIADEWVRTFKGIAGL